MRPIREAYIEQCEAAGKHAYSESLRQIPQDPFGIEGEIADIMLYPGKALGGLSIEEALISEYGLQTREGLRDRAFMIGKRSNRKEGPMYRRFSQREEPKLALLQPHFDGRILTYEAPRMPKLKIGLDELEPRPGDPITVEAVRGTIVPTVLERGPINAHIRAYLRQFRDDVDDIEVLLPALNMERMVEERHRRNQPARTVFSDGGSVLLASVSSHAFVEERRKQGPNKDGPETSAGVTRGNIRVRNWPANLEDILDYAIIEGELPLRGIRHIRVYNQAALLSLLCGDLSIRCKVTQADPATGTFRKDREPYATYERERPLRLDGDRTPTACVNTVFDAAALGGQFRKGSKIFVGTEKRVE